MHYDHPVGYKRAEATYRVPSTKIFYMIPDYYPLLHALYPPFYGLYYCAHTGARSACCTCSYLLTTATPSQYKTCYGHGDKRYVRPVGLVLVRENRVNVRDAGLSLLRSVELALESQPRGTGAEVRSGVE